jgi:hypothetical protein
MDFKIGNFHDSVSAVQGDGFHIRILPAYGRYANRMDEKSNTSLPNFGCRVTIRRHGLDAQASSSQRAGARPAAGFRQSPANPEQ